ncbi:MAG TPA: ATP-binding protein [Chryseosolibacter sp.]
MAIFLSKANLEAEVSKRVAEACEQIISEMGAELHDDLMQKLSVFRLYIDRMERAAGDKAEIDSLSIKMRTEFDQVIHVMRNISRRLLPAKMEGETLEKILEMLCQNMEHPGTGHIHFENQGTPVPLAPQTERYIFRIVQELIHNAFKHSSAWHIWVRVKWFPDNLTIEVEDDGTGFSKIPEFIQRLKRKNNTLRLRSSIIGGQINYAQGAKGLLARLILKSENFQRVNEAL